jgi:hypothetical protein
MSKEREMLRALQETIATPTPTPLPEAVPDAGSATFTWENASVLLSDIASSMVENPLFYLKLSGVLVLGAVILVVAFQLIFTE